MPYEMKETDWLRILNFAFDPVFVHDQKFRLLFANRAYLECADISEQEALGRPYWEVFPKGTGPLQSCVDAMAQNETFCEEISLPDGKVFLSHNTPVADESGNYIYSLHILVDITEITQARERIERLNRLNRTISLGNQTLIRAENEIAFSQAMCEVLVNHGGYRTAWVGLKGEDAEKIVRIIAAEGIELNTLREPGLTWEDNEIGQAPTGKCIRTGRLVRHRNLQEETHAPLQQVTDSLGAVESLSLPLMIENQVIGAITVSATSHELLGEKESRLLTEMADDLAFGITKLRAIVTHISTLEKLEHSLDDTVTAIAATVEMRDPYTAGHQRRVAKLAAAIGVEMELPSDQIEGLRIAAVVHDIGKIHVPAEILSNPGKLTTAEFDIIKTHCQAGYEILHPIDFPWPVAEIVLQHHEKLDGSGYPNGLKKDEILLEAKILSVADVIEAMSSHRPYRPGLGTFQALQDISRNRGTLYDEDAVQAALNLFHEKNYEL
jgi:putative nucleotidyltransferase with HDIG domain/PAS domain S-box-containing protein